MSSQEIGSSKAVRWRRVGKRAAYPVQIPTLPGMTTGGEKELSHEHFLVVFFLLGQKVLEQGFIKIVFLPIPAFHRAGGKT